MNRFRVAMFFGAVSLASSIWSQPLFEAWRNAGAPRSDVNVGGFIKNNRTVHGSLSMPGGGIQMTSIVCSEPDGSTVWTYPVAGSGYPQSMLTTTDNMIYLVYDGGPSGPFVLALTQDGQFAWRWDYTLGNADRRLTEMRIFGNKLLVAGSGRTGIFGTDQRLVLISLDRFTGGLGYAREYLPGNANMPSFPSVRSNGTYAFLKGNRYTGAHGVGGTGIVKLDPATGDVISQYAVQPYESRQMEVDSTSHVYLSGELGFASDTTDIRKLNASGTGTMQLVYRKTGGGGPFVLSQGHMYVLEWRPNYAFRKVRLSDGATIWHRLFAGPNDGFWDLRADAHGRIFATNRWVNTIETVWGIQRVDPATGANVGPTHVVARSDDWELNSLPRSVALNSYGEIFTTGTEDAPSDQRYWVAARLYQAPEPVDDTFTVVQGELFTTSGLGLFANDSYTNPALTLSSVVPGFEPQMGVLNVGSSGGFTYLAKEGGNPLAPGPQMFRYRSVRGSASGEATVTLNVIRGVLSLGLARYTVAGNSTVSGAVTASTVGTAMTVTLSENSANVSLPATVTIPAGAPKATFIVTAQEVSVAEVCTITATFGGASKTVSLNLQPLQVVSFTVSTSVVQGGEPFHAVIKMNGRAGPGGLTLNLTDDSPYIQTPGTITVPAGATEVFVTIPTTDPGIDITAAITVSGAGAPIVRVVHLR